MTGIMLQLDIYESQFFLWMLHDSYMSEWPDSYAGACVMKQDAVHMCLSVKNAHHIAYIA